MTIEKMLKTSIEFLNEGYGENKLIFKTLKEMQPYYWLNKK